MIPLSTSITIFSIFTYFLAFFALLRVTRDLFSTIVYMIVPIPVAIIFFDTTVIVLFSAYKCLSFFGILFLPLGPAIFFGLMFLVNGVSEMAGTGKDRVAILLFSYFTIAYIFIFIISKI